MGNNCCQPLISRMIAGKLPNYGGGGAAPVPDNQVLMQETAQYIGSNPADNQNWHFSNAISGLQIPSNFARCRFKFGQQMNINKVSWSTMTKGTLGSDEAVTIWLRDINGNNIIEISTEVRFNSAFLTGTADLDIDIGEDEVYMFGWQNPAYSTNPTNCFLNFVLQGTITT